MLSEVGIKDVMSAANFHMVQKYVQREREQSNTAEIKQLRI